jgi:hypothetical protein
MRRQIKSHWRNLLCAAIACITSVGAAQMQVAAQDTTQTFNYLFQSSASRNLWLKDAAGNFDFTNVKPNVLLNENPAQDDELPKPDFSAMDEWYEIRKWEYDFYSFGAKMNLVIVAKKESRPKAFDLVSKDADGVIVPMGEVLICGTTLSYPMVVNQAYRCALGIPEKKVLKTVKTMRAVERE